MKHPLQDLRDYYLDCFRKSIDKAGNRFDQFTTELLLEIPSLKHAEYCYRLYRADIIGKRAGETGVMEVNVKAKVADTSQAVFPTAVRIDAPLVWNGVQFRVAGHPPAEKDLIAWASRWLDVSDSRFEQSVLFQQVAHSILPPRQTESGFDLSIDFGSAPTTAFDELLDLLIPGASVVSVGSFHMAQQEPDPPVGTYLGDRPEQHGSFNFWKEDGEDIYSADDGEAL